VFHVRYVPTVLNYHKVEWRKPEYLGRKDAPPLYANEVSFILHAFLFSLSPTLLL
jgi:hypothetical protein